MLELVQVTAQYSNAVLVAVLPYISQFAEKLNLPLSIPVSPAHIAYFKCDPRKDHTGGMVVLTNRFQFTFLDGRVCVYRSPGSYFSLQDIDVPSEFYGPVNVKEAEALEIAHDAIRKLGYTDKILHADTKPKISPPERIGANYIPRYRLRWLDPLWRGARTAASPLPTVLDIEVNAQNRRIEMFATTSRETQGPSPKVDIQPPLLPSQSKGPHLVQGAQTLWASKEYASAILTNVVSLVSDFVRKARLPVIVPVTVSDVDASRYTCVLEQGRPVIQLYLKNADRFNYAHGHVTAFYAHDAFFKFPEMGRVDDFLGKINVSTNAAISLSKDILKRLGCRRKVDIAFGPPAYIPSDKFTRYFVRYNRPADTFPVASFEIDLTDGSVKSVYLDDPSLWSEPPNINVPMLADTNSVPRKALRQ